MNLTANEILAIEIIDAQRNVLAAREVCNAAVKAERIARDRLHLADARLFELLNQVQP